MSRHALWTLVAIVAVELGLVGAGGAYYVLSQTGGVNGPVVIASFYPYQFLASRVAGDRFAVTALVPPGGEPHGWEPTPRVVLTSGSAAALVYQGAVGGCRPVLPKELPPARPRRDPA